jgi:hypothetical protein
MNGARQVNAAYDAHEIILNQFDAPHEWWNLVAGRFPVHHKDAIHGTGAAYQGIVQNFGS